MQGTPPRRCPRAVRSHWKIERGYLSAYSTTASTKWRKRTKRSLGASKHRCMCHSSRYLSRLNAFPCFVSVPDGWLWQKPAARILVLRKFLRPLLLPLPPAMLTAADTLRRLRSAVLLRPAPTNNQSLSGKIAAHYSAAAGLFALERDEVTLSLERAAAAVAIAEESSNTAAENRRPPPPPSASGSLGSGGLSPWVRIVYG